MTFFSFMSIYMFEALYHVSLAAMLLFAGAYALASLYLRGRADVPLAGFIIVAGFFVLAYMPHVIYPGSPLDVGQQAVEVLRHNAQFFARAYASGLELGEAYSAGRAALDYYKTFYLLSSVSKYVAKLAADASRSSWGGAAYFLTDYLFSLANRAFWHAVKLLNLAADLLNFLAAFIDVGRFVLPPAALVLALVGAREHEIQITAVAMAYSWYVLSIAVLAAGAVGAERGLPQPEGYGVGQVDVSTDGIHYVVALTDGERYYAFSTTLPFAQLLLTNMQNATFVAGAKLFTLAELGLQGIYTRTVYVDGNVTAYYANVTLLEAAWRDIAIPLCAAVEKISYSPGLFGRPAEAKMRCGENALFNISALYTAADLTVYADFFNKTSLDPLSWEPVLFPRPRISFRTPPQFVAVGWTALAYPDAWSLRWINGTHLNATIRISCYAENYGRYLTGDVFEETGYGASPWICNIPPIGPPPWIAGTVAWSRISVETEVEPPPPGVELCEEATLNVNARFVYRPWPSLAEKPKDAELWPYMYRRLLETPITPVKEGYIGDPDLAQVLNASRNVFLEMREYDINKTKTDRRTFMLTATAGTRYVKRCEPPGAPPENQTCWCEAAPAVYRFSATASVVLERVDPPNFYWVDPRFNETVYTSAVALGSLFGEGPLLEGVLSLAALMGALGGLAPAPFNVLTSLLRMALIDVESGGIHVETSDAPFSPSIPAQVFLRFEGARCAYLTRLHAKQELSQEAEQILEMMNSFINSFERTFGAEVCHAIAVASGYFRALAVNIVVAVSILIGILAFAGRIEPEKYMQPALSAAPKGIRIATAQVWQLSVAPVAARAAPLLSRRAAQLQQRAEMPGAKTARIAAGAAYAAAAGIRIAMLDVHALYRIAMRNAALLAARLSDLDKLAVTPKRTAVAAALKDFVARELLWKYRRFTPREEQFYKYAETAYHVMYLNSPAVLSMFIYEHVRQLAETYHTVKALYGDEFAEKYPWHRRGVPDPLEAVVYAINRGVRIKYVGVDVGKLAEKLKLPPEEAALKYLKLYDWRGGLDDGTLRRLAQHFGVHGTALALYVHNAYGPRWESIEAAAAAAAYEGLLDEVLALRRHWPLIVDAWAGDMPKGDAALRVKTLHGLLEAGKLDALLKRPTPADVGVRVYTGEIFAMADAKLTWGDPRLRELYEARDDIWKKQFHIPEVDKVLEPSWSAVNPIVPILHSGRAISRVWAVTVYAMRGGGVSVDKEGNVYVGGVKAATLEEVVDIARLSASPAKPLLRGDKVEIGGELYTYEELVRRRGGGPLAELTAAAIFTAAAANSPWEAEGQGFLRYVALWSAASEAGDAAGRAIFKKALETDASPLDVIKAVAAYNEGGLDEALAVLEKKKEPSKDLVEEVMRIIAGRQPPTAPEATADPAFFAAVFASDEWSLPLPEALPSSFEEAVEVLKESQDPVIRAAAKKVIKSHDYIHMADKMPERAEALWASAAAALAEMERLAAAEAFEEAYSQFLKTWSPIPRRPEYELLPMRHLAYRASLDALSRPDAPLYVKALAEKHLKEGDLSILDVLFKKQN